MTQTKTFYAPLPDRLQYITIQAPDREKAKTALAKSFPECDRIFPAKKFNPEKYIDGKHVELIWECD